MGDHEEDGEHAEHVEHEERHAQHGEYECGQAEPAQHGDHEEDGEHAEHEEHEERAVHEGWSLHTLTCLSEGTIILQSHLSDQSCSYRFGSGTRKCACWAEAMPSRLFFFQLSSPATLTSSSLVCCG